MTDIQPGTQTVVQDSQHANTPAITTLHRSLALLRIPVLRCGSCAGSDEDESEVSHLLQRTYRYSGKERDVTGLIHYGWRYYQPETGRWLSADPGGLIDGANLFRFCLNNPVNMADKDGLMPFPCINRGGQQQVSLVYSMDDGRYGGGREEYIDGHRTRKAVKVTINSLNEVLGISGAALQADMSSVLTRIKEGIAVDGARVDRFIKHAPGLKKSSAFTLLSGWSSHLQENAHVLQPGRKIAQAHEPDKMRVAEQYVKKNLGGSALGVNGAKTLRNVLARYTAHLALGNAENGKLPDEGLSEDEKKYQKRLKQALEKDFFRKTSKLGLDWAFSVAAHVDSVEFLRYGRNQKGEPTGNVTGVMNQSKEQAHLQHRDRDFSEAGGIAYPITLSELRHIQKKSYHERQNFKWIKR